MYKDYNKIKIDIKPLARIFILIIFILPFLGGCRVAEKNFELSKYNGKSIKSFERKTRTDLIQEGNGVYKIEDRLQLIAPKGDITSITILKGAEKFKLFGLEIGMDKKEAEKKLAEVYKSEVNKTIESEKNSITYTYRNSDSELFVSYDINSDLVTEISYYYYKDEKAQSEDIGNAGELIALIGNDRVYYNEAMVYLKSAQEIYESDYGNGIWEAEIFEEGKSFGEYIKEEVIKQITQLKVIRDKATENGIALTEEEEAEAAAYAAAHFAGLSDEDIDRYLVTPKLLEQVYADNLLAEKVFETLTIDVDTHVPDDIARQITIQHILIYGTYLNDENKRVPLDDEQKDKAYEKISGLLERVKNEEDFYTLAEANTEAGEIELTFGKDGGPKEYGKEFKEAAFSLKTGEVSDIISTDYGWHIIYCVSDFNEDATTKVKEEIIEERRTKLFANLYEEWSSDYEVVVNKEAWDSISFD